MGVTIHFEGQVRDEAAYAAVIALAEEFASTHGWEAHRFTAQEASLLRVRDEQNWDYVGPTKGVELRPHANSEPVRLEFDENLYIQEYTKTQFAPLHVHVNVVELLSILAPQFQELQIYDEGEFYETGDELQLRKLIDRCNTVLEETLAKDQTLQGPVRLPSGRIADIVSDF